MNKKLIIDSVKVKGNKIQVEFSVSQDIEKFFISPYEFYVEYSVFIGNIDMSLAVIPFVCNVLPIIWLTDTTLVIDELDKDFYESIDEIKEGYIKMYPNFKFGGTVVVNNVKNNTNSIFKSPSTSEKSIDVIDTNSNKAVLFSGGVDAFATLIAHLKEKPLLVTLWGSDIPLNDWDGWENVHTHVLNTAKDYNLNAEFIKTNFRKFINYKQLNYIVRESKDNYWHGFQHGIGILGHTAPLVKVNNLSKIYIASSYTEKENVVCASHPSIDEKVKFAGCTVVHDQYEFDRQEKVDHIVAYSKDFVVKPNLRVCYITTGGKNCCKCEKCLRTMFEIFASGGDPRSYGFTYTNKDLRKSKINVFSKGLDHIAIQGYWLPLQRRFSKLEDTIPSQIEWIKTIDFEKEIQSPKMRVIKFMYTLPKRILNRLKRFSFKSGNN